MDNPATTDLNTGQIELHPSFWKLGTNEKKFVLFHEKAHFNLQTTDEVAADNQAIVDYEKENPANIYDLQNFLTEALPKTGSENIKRRHNIILKALYYDYVHNGNAKAYEILQQMKKKKYLYKVTSNFTDKRDTSVITADPSLQRGTTVVNNEVPPARNVQPIGRRIIELPPADNTDTATQTTTTTTTQTNKTATVTPQTATGFKKYVTTQNIVIVLIIIAIAAYFIFKKK